MNQTIEDLWGKIEISSHKNIPFKLLNEQAKLIKPKTKEVLDAEVLTSTDSGIIYHYLYIIAPKIDGYMYPILKTASGSQPYPIYIYDYSVNKESVEVKNRKMVQNPFIFVIETSKNSYELNKIPEPDYISNGYEEFKSIISKILSSERTVSIIHSLLAQSEL